MEGSQPVKSKKKSKKKRSKSTGHEEPSTSYQSEGKLLNLDFTTTDVNDLILPSLPDEQHDGPGASSDFYSLHDANSVLTIKELDEIIDQVKPPEDIVDDECITLTLLNNLDLASGRNEDLLRKSQLNVFDCSEEVSIPQESPIEDVNTPKQQNVLEDGDTPKEHNVIEDEYETQAEVDQLYPSLDEGFYQGLQEKSTVMNRSLSQISCPNFEDADALSMQTAEAQLNNIANYLNDENYINPDELTSFEVVHVIDGEACIDNQSIISESTVHHLSLQTLTFDDHFEGKFQSGYHSNCVSPTQSLPNFEELNREILINELKLYYHNPQLTSNEEFLEDFFSMCENQNHEFHLLLSRYQSARQSYLQHNAVIESNISKCIRTEETIWTFPKEKKVEYGYCADHIKVSFTENCTKAHCHQEGLKEMSDNLNAVHEACNIPLALLQYNWKIDFYHVEQYLVKLVQTCPPLYHITDMVTSYIPGVLIPWDHINQTTQLRVCISILFHFKRQKSNDDIFTQDVDRWLRILVGLLLRVATLLDHRFILNHLLRCPTAFSFWGSSYLQLVWSEATFNTETIIGNPIIDHFLLMYLTLISPLTRRDNMLVNYEAPIQDSDPAEWALLDELGEVNCDEKQLLERDYIQLLGQFNFGMFYRELLKFQTPEEFIKSKDKINEQEIMTLLSMCLKCILFIKESYSHLDFTRYRNFCQRNAKIMTTFVRFASDYYYFYEGYGGKYERWSNTVDHDFTKLRTLHDHVFQEGFRCLAETSNVSLWQFLDDLPYHRVSIKVLWKLYGFLHQVNPEKQFKSSILKEGTPYDIITKLYRTARFQKRLEGLSDEDCTFMINVFCKMATSRERSVDDNFIKVIGLDIYHIGVTASAEKQSTDRACKNGLSNIIDHCPEVVSVIINNIEKPTLKDLPNNLKILRGISLSSWNPHDNDLILLTTWLQSTSITSLTNQLSRIIIKGMNWGTHKNQLFLSCDVHRKMAVVIVSAHSYHLPDRPGYLIHSAAPDFAKHVSNSDKNIFVKWCWEVLLMLCLHKADLHDHDSLTQKLVKQHSRQLRRQKSETVSSTPTRITSAAGSESSSSSSTLPRQCSAGVLQPTAPPLSITPELAPGESSSSFVGRWGKFPYKMRKETNLSSLCEALRTNGEMASFVALSITSIGHTIIDFQADGMQLLALLQRNNHYRAVLQILTNMFTITMRNNCLDLLLQLPEFVPLVLGLAKAQYCSSISGKTSHPVTGFVINKMTHAYKSGREEGNLCMKYWLHLFFSVPNFHSEPSIVVILDKMFRVIFRYEGDEHFLLQLLHVHLTKAIDTSRHNSSKIMSIMSWFTTSSYTTSLLQQLTNPGEVFWWSYYVTKMECTPQHSTQFFQILTEVLLTNPELTIDYAIRRTHTLVDREEVANVNLSNLAIYRWGSLLQTVPMEHPLLPYAWQEFFKLYLHRPVPESAGVGYRFYQGMFYARDLRAMKQRLVETSKHFQLDEEEEEITEEMLFGSKLAHFFMSLSLWADETRLHEANLFVPGLPQQYNGPKLTDILQGREVEWVDMVNTTLLDHNISSDIAEWSKYTARRYSPRFCRKEEETATYLVEQLYECVRQNLTETEAPPELVIPQSHIPPLPAVPDQDSLSLISLVGPYFGKLKSHAERFVELSNNVKTLNKAYFEELPNMYYNRNTQRTELVPCYSRMGPIGRCNGPAMLSVTSTQFHDNLSAIDLVNGNRLQYEQVLTECRKELENDVCITAMFLENIVSDLYRTHREHPVLGKQLFYHVVEQLTEAVWQYPPSQQIFAFSIDCLGQFFIRNNPEETVSLLNKILTRAQFATILAPLFQPNQGYEHFVEIYTHVIQSVSLCDIDVGFTILSKFDIKSWLTTPYATVENCKRLLDTVYLGLDIYRYNEGDTNFLMFYDTLKLHLRHILCNRLSGLLQYTVEKTLDLSQKFPHHQQIWSEIIEVLELEHSQQWITLSTCHRVLYEISKYFLQYKKSILKAVPHDLYSDWSCYTTCIIALYNVLCTTYITKAAYLGYQQASDMNLPADGAMPKPTSMASEEQTACIFTMTCSVFGPWILVFEEACLPWSEAHIQEADKVLHLFSEMLMLIDNEIQDTTPLLHRLWWYYMEMLGHPIVPEEMTSRYYEHLTLLPWDTFVPTLDILHSFLRCVRNNRNNVAFVIYLMTQVDWQKVVVELEKESYAFDLLVDVLITFALSNDIFFKFGQEFISLFRKFKALDLSLVSDQGFSSILHRIDKTVQHGQHLQSLTNTGHLIQLMGGLCRFKHRDSSYVKHVCYFKHVVNIASKISNPQYVEMLVQCLLYNIEQVFYCSCSSEHIEQLCATLLALFNKTPADVNTHLLSVKKMETALKEKGSVKEGYSFSQLCLYYLSALTHHVQNIRVLAMCCEILIESYFIHCENCYPVLSVSWNTLHERFSLNAMYYESFINHSVQEGGVLNLYLYTHHLLISATDMDQKYSAVAMLLDTTSRIVPKPREEQKLLLLWFKIFDILIDLHSCGIRSSAISSIVKQLPTNMFKLAEDRESSGIFGTSWFGKKSKFSLEFRMIARIVATFLLHQLNKDGSLRITPNTRHNLSSDANKAMDNIRSLVNNKSYAAHISTLQHCIGMILDTTRTFLHIRDLVRFLTTTSYHDKSYLSEIFYFKTS